MDESIGKMLCRTATIIAGLIVVSAIVSFVFNADKGVPIISLAALLLAAAIWLVGLVCRHVLTAREESN